MRSDANELSGRISLPSVGEKLFVREIGTEVQGTFEVAARHPVDANHARGSRRGPNRWDRLRRGPA